MKRTCILFQRRVLVDQRKPVLVSTCSCLGKWTKLSGVSKSFFLTSDGLQPNSGLLGSKVSFDLSSFFGNMKRRDGFWFWNRLIFEILASKLSQVLFRPLNLGVLLLLCKLSKSKSVKGGESFTQKVSARWQNETFTNSQDLVFGCSFWKSWSCSRNTSSSFWSDAFSCRSCWNSLLRAAIWWWNASLSMAQKLGASVVSIPWSFLKVHVRNLQCPIPRTSQHFVEVLLAVQLTGKRIDCYLDTSE